MDMKRENSMDAREHVTKSEDKLQEKSKRKDFPKTSNGSIKKKSRKKSSKRAEHEHDKKLKIIVPEEYPNNSRSIFDDDCLSRPSRGTRVRKDEDEDQVAGRVEKIAGAVRTIIECPGEDPDREGLLRTPERYAKAMLYFTEGYQENVNDIVNDAIFHQDHTELVIVKDIEIFSLCEHHMVPFTGKMHIGYIPEKNVIGISKLPRIADLFTRRFQVEKYITTDVGHAIMEIV